MVCSVSAIKDAGAASEYYSQTDDYYSENGHAPTAWQGRGAEALGLTGPVATAQAENLMRGYLPNGERVGGDDHRAGWDVTFSAPKSVSVAVYVHGDDRLIAAHDAAVKAALDYLERETACTRIRESGEIRTEATGNLVVASYRHDTNREQECQLHTHNIVMNLTQSADKQWRSIESKPLYRLQTEAGAVYRASLARAAERLGYDIEKTQEGKHPSFELRQVGQAERELFSSRSRQIEIELQKMGLTRESATPEQKQMAALATRHDKKELDRAELLETWRSAAMAAGYAVHARPDVREIPSTEYEKRADAALAHAVSHLSERESRFTTRQLVAEARRVGMGGIDDKDIESAIGRAASQGDLLPTHTRQFDAIHGRKAEGAGWTTAVAQATETRMLALAGAGGAGSATPVTTPEGATKAIARQEAATGFSFNPAQRSAATAILAGSERVTLVQGYAGTAKTTSVLAAAAAEFKAQGYDVVALAPTHSAAGTLGTSIDAESSTVAKFLGSQSPSEGASRSIVYIVDEASMLSAKDMTRLLEKTQNGRVVLVGDIKQLGSVEAGSAFRQLQNDSGLKPQILDEIVRQKNDQLLQAVHSAIAGDASGALSKVEVRELETREQRVAAIADDFTAMSAEERQKTIIIAPGRDDRREINEAVRDRLKAAGELAGEVEIDILEKRDLTAAEAKRADSYVVGDQVQAAREYKSLGLAKGGTAQVVGVDVDRNRVTLLTVDGKQIEIDPARFSKLCVFEARKLDVAIGDKLVMRENSEKLKNGSALRVEKIDERHVHGRDEAGKLHKIDRATQQKLDHGYAQTAHAAQGRTSQNVLVHAESHRVNLQNQKNIYVSLSRATTRAIVYTDNRERLAEQIGRETGQKETALNDNPHRLSESEIVKAHPNRMHISESDSHKAHPNASAKRDARLADAALKTSGPMPDAKRVNKDIEAGAARWTRDSSGERYLQYKDGRTYHQELHGRIRETDLRQLATLGMTQKKAVLVDKHLIDFKVAGRRIQAIKTGEKVLISRESAVGKWAGAQKDLMRERHQEQGRGGVLRRANDAAKSAVLTKVEGWREATLQESIRARISVKLETSAMRDAARERLTEKVEAVAGKPAHENVRMPKILESPSAPTPTRVNDNGMER